MDNNLLNRNIRIGAAFLGATLVSAGISYAIVSSGFASAHSAAWVQAFGATAGIGIAMWLPYKQREDALSAERNRRKENAKRLCQALRDELVLTQLSFGTDFYKEMLIEDAEDAFTFAVPKGENAFPVYKAMVGQLIEIDDGDVRRAIILAYGTFFELLEMLEVNDEVRESSYTHYVNNKELVEKLGRLSYDSLAATYKGRLLGMRGEIQRTAKKFVNNVSVAVDLLNAQCDDRVSVVPHE